ncbi:pyruvate kinase [Chlamydiales bacterium]|nr:pyruvate kinase [Chlamydiales bacterium]
MKRTKIICTIGPAVNTYEKICELIESGMNVARLNFSHGTHAYHLEEINLLKKARKEMKVPLAIMLDTKGPEVRIGPVKEGNIFLKNGSLWELTKDEIIGDENQVSIYPSSVIDKISVGAHILFNDGYLSSTVVEKKENSLIVRIEVGGYIGSGKGVNVPNESLDLPAVTEKDVADICFGCKNGVDIIAASFIRSADHIFHIKNLLAEQNASEILVIAKIENHEGVEHFDSIVQVSDGIMIARGDLGVEVPLTEVPRLQKMMIRKCYLAGKPVVTATQMLETMIEHSRPTRAETSDVANAIYDSTSSVMLSGETAIGKYPIQTVQVMRDIVMASEADFNYRKLFDDHSELNYHDVPSAVTLATVKTAYNSQAKAIFIFTNSGGTARLISRLRPEMPIIAVTPNKKSYNQLSFNWGVIPLLKECNSLTEAFAEASAFALNLGIAQYGDLVVITAGNPFGISGTTNMMIVESIGDVLVRGDEGKGKGVHGNILFVPSSSSKKPYQVHNQILVMTHCDEAFEPLIKEARGIILQNHIDDKESEKIAHAFGETYHIPVITRADGASLVLKQGQLVTMEPKKGLVYKGVVL